MCVGTSEPVETEDSSDLCMDDGRKIVCPRATCQHVPLKSLVVLKVATFQPLFIATFRLLLSFRQENDVKVR